MGQLSKFLVKRLRKENRAYIEGMDTIDRMRYLQVEDMDTIDRISSLPVEIQVHILSFLRNKEAVQTCVLSKTWRKTWSSLPILYFDSQEFLLDYLIENVSNNIRREYEHKFEKFVKAVLQNRKALSETKDCVSHFVILSETKDCVSCNSEAFKDCILCALEFKPRLLGVLCCNHKLLSSYDIFTCASLEEVLFDNRGNSFEIAPNSVCLPRLKRLDLTRVIVSDNFLDKLFLGCPIIEELNVHHCILRASRICSVRLKRLGLLRCYFKRRITLALPCTEILVHFPRTPLVSGPELIGSISDVTFLNLALSGTQVKGLFEDGVPVWPIFKNLKGLKLGGWCLNSDFYLVAFFLQSPNLQTLVLDGYNRLEVAADEKSNWEEPKAVMFQRELLQEVTIRKSGKSDEWVHQLINNLRAHVKTIGKIKINV